MTSAQKISDGKVTRTVWDPMLRVLHWSLVVMVVSALWLGHYGPVVKTWHFWLGYALGGWLVVRLGWGLIGPASARLSGLVHGPKAILKYARILFRRRPSHWPGHNPLGGLSVVAMLLVLTAQIGTGLFADDEVFSAGPLSHLVSEQLRLTLTSWHAIGGWILLTLIVLHLGAIVFYALWKRENLIWPMITGRARTEDPK